GQWERGVALVNKGHALNAVSASGFYHTTLFYDYYLRGEYRKAVEVIRQHPRQGLLEILFKYVMAYGQLGESTKAQEYWAKYVAFTPQFSVDWVRDNVLARWNFRGADADLLLQGIAKAASTLRS